MRLYVIDDEDEISKCQDMLAERLRTVGELKRGNYGHQGHNDDLDMYRFLEEKFWWGYMRIIEGTSPRHWNAFGLAESFTDSKTFDITCEINVRLSKGTWHVAGAFARDGDGETYIVHSGRIGGGRKEIGRNLFMSHFAEPRLWIGVERNGAVKPAVVVSPLDDGDLIQNLAFFVKEVHRIKGLANKKELSGDGMNIPAPPPRPGGFSPEFEGYRRPYSIKKEIQAGGKHGRIVRALYDLATVRGIEAWNNQRTDLFLKRKAIAMLEVKTGKDVQSRYTAIGQLLYHSGSDKRTRLVAVFPSIDNEFKNVLRRLGIAGVTWSKSDHGCKFSEELDMLLESL